MSKDCYRALLEGRTFYVLSCGIIIEGTLFLSFLLQSIVIPILRLLVYV